MKQAKRTAYMQKVMNTTYNSVAIEAILTGFAGAWERLISRRLTSDAKNGISEAEMILLATGNDPMMAAKLVLESKAETTTTVEMYGDEKVMIIDNQIINL